MAIGCAGFELNRDFLENVLASFYSGCMTESLQSYRLIFYFFFEALKEEEAEPCESILIKDLLKASAFPSKGWTVNWKPRPTR